MLDFFFWAGTRVKSVSSNYQVRTKDTHNCVISFCHPFGHNAWLRKPFLSFLDTWASGETIHVPEKTLATTLSLFVLPRWSLQLYEITTTGFLSPRRDETTEKETAREKLTPKNITQRDSNPWPPRYQSDALPTALWSLTGSRSRASSIYTRYTKNNIQIQY